MGLTDPPDLNRFFSDVPFGFPCPHCGHQFEQLLGWFEVNDYFICPNCTERTNLNAAHIRKGLKEARESLKLFWSDLPYFFKGGK